MKLIHESLTGRPFLKANLNLLLFLYNFTLPALDLGSWDEIYL